MIHVFNILYCWDRNGPLTGHSRFDMSVPKLRWILHLVADWSCACLAWDACRLA